MLAPRGTPQPVINKLSDALTRIASTPEFKEYCLVQGIEVDVQPASVAKADAPVQYEKWRKMVELVKAKTR